MSDNWRLEVLLDHLKACASGRINHLTVNFTPMTAEMLIRHIQSQPYFDVQIDPTSPDKMGLIAELNRRHARLEELARRRNLPPGNEAT